MGPVMTVLGGRTARNGSKENQVDRGDRAGESEMLNGERRQCQRVCVGDQHVPRAARELRQLRWHRLDDCLWNGRGLTPKIVAGSLNFARGGGNKGIEVPKVECLNKLLRRLHQLLLRLNVY